MTLQSQDVQQTPQKRSRGRPKKIVQSTSQLQGISSTSLISHLMQDSTIQHSAEQTSTTHINYKNGRGHNNGGISNLFFHPFLELLFFNDLAMVSATNDPTGNYPFKDIEDYALKALATPLHKLRSSIVLVFAF
jgi:hypothetical protein